MFWSDEFNCCCEVKYYYCPGKTVALNHLRVIANSARATEFDAAHLISQLRLLSTIHTLYTFAITVEFNYTMCGKVCMFYFAKKRDCTTNTHTAQINSKRFERL